MSGLPKTAHIPSWDCRHFHICVYADELKRAKSERLATGLCWLQCRGCMYYAYGTRKCNLEQNLLAKIKLTAKQKKVAIGVATGFLVLCVAVGAVRLMDNSQKTSEKKEVDFIRLVGRTQVEATDHLNNDDVDGGLALYDSQIKIQNGDNEKKALLVFKSNFAVLAGRYDEAITIAKQADDMGSDATTLKAVAEAYEANGDKNQAVEYYKKLLEVRGPAEGSTEDSLIKEKPGPSIEYKIKELGG